MRIYEELFIVRPDATDEEVDPLIEQLKNVHHPGWWFAGKDRKVGSPQARLPGHEVQRRAIYSAPIQCAS